MGLRVTDAVIADHDITNTVTGNAVTRGHLGGDAEQTGSAPSTYPVRFPPDRLGRSVVLDELTDHDIGRPGINDEESGAPAGDDPDAAHPWNQHRAGDPWSSPRHRSDAGTSSSPFDGSRDPDGTDRLRLRRTQFTAQDPAGLAEPPATDDGEVAAGPGGA
jgi:hypothetical protein